MSWTEDRIELLTKLWGEGQTASKIAHALGGVTRNAVIGKVHRLGLSNRSTKSASSPEKPSQDNDAIKPSLKRTKPQSVEKVADGAGAAPKHIVPAGRPMPPQPSANEISAKTLASHREALKSALHLDLMELTERTCRWPIGDPATHDFSFCGLPVEPGKPYCKPCAELAYYKPTARRDRRG